MIRVLLVDDHSLVRSGLKHVLEEAPDISVAAEAANGLEAIAEFRRTHPEVVILDISMPGMDGLETLDHLTALDSAVRVLVLTMYPEEQFALRVFRAGALGYITKGTSPRDLHKAVRTVVQGRRYLSDEVENAISLQLLANRPEETPLGTLSRRELQVLCLIARGHKLSRIAADLGLSVKTIETYRSRVLQKLCLQTDADICRFAYDNALADGLPHSANGAIP